MANAGFLRFIACAVAVSLCTVAARAATPMQQMSFLKGVWSCSISSPLGHQTEIDHNAPIGEAWIHISGAISAGMGRPARWSCPMSSVESRVERSG